MHMRAEWQNIVSLIDDVSKKIFKNSLQSAFVSVFNVVLQFVNK